jgi:hypothetical protein
MEERSARGVQLRIGKFVRFQTAGVVFRGYPSTRLVIH